MMMMMMMMMMMLLYIYFSYQALPDSVKKKDDVDGSSTMDEIVKVAVSGARGTLLFLPISFGNNSFTIPL